MKKGRAQTMTHDYKRNGTTTLGGLNWSSQHLDGGGCDGQAEATVGSVWTEAVYIPGAAAGGGAQGTEAVLGCDCGGPVE
jgi:hypothetical protein